MKLTLVNRNCAVRDGLREGKGRREEGEKEHTDECVQVGSVARDSEVSAILRRTGQEYFYFSPMTMLFEVDGSCGCAQIAFAEPGEIPPSCVSFTLDLWVS